MHLNELKTFLAIVETGSLVGASQTLNVTQSTVTARLKSLEEEIGQELITRHRSGASLTAAGQRLKRYAQTISDLWQQAQQETALPSALSSVCNIGCHADLWPNLGEKLFDYIRTELPEVAISVWYGGQIELTNWINDGLIDLSLTYWPNLTQKQQAFRLYADELILVSTNPDAPIRFDPGYVYVEAGEEFGRDHAAFYSDANIARLSFGSAQLGLDYILKNTGTAYLPRRMVSKLISENTLFEIKEGPAFERHIFLIGNNTAIAKWPWIDQIVQDLAV